MSHSWNKASGAKIASLGCLSYWGLNKDVSFQLFLIAVRAKINTESDDLKTAGRHNLMCKAARAVHVWCEMARFALLYLRMHVSSCFDSLHTPSKPWLSLQVSRLLPLFSSISFSTPSFSISLSLSLPPTCCWQVVSLCCSVVAMVRANQCVCVHAWVWVCVCG